MKMIALEWRYTYRSARRGGGSRSRAFRQFAREVLKGWQLHLGLHPKYRRDGGAR